MYQSKLSNFVFGSEKTKEITVAYEQAMKQAIEQAGLNCDDWLAEPFQDVKCKTFVLTMSINNLRCPVRLRSYSSRMDSASSDFRIWEAGRATSASPVLVHPVFVGGVTYMGADNGFTNCAMEALDEAARIWQLSEIKCLISIGAGLMPPARLEIDSVLSHNPLRMGRMGEFINALARSVADTERNHQQLKRITRMLGLKYFRLNANGLDKVHNREWAKLSVVKSETALYLQDEALHNELSFCALHLLQGLESPPQVSSPNNSDSVRATEKTALSAWTMAPPMLSSSAAAVEDVAAGDCLAQNAGPDGERGTADCGLLFDDFSIETSSAHAEASVLIIPILHRRLTILGPRQPIDGSVISSATSIRSWRSVGEPAQRKSRLQCSTVE